MIIFNKFNKKCCGDDIPKYHDKEGLFKRLRNIDDLEVNMKLSQFTCDFNQHNGIWKNNFNTVQPLMSLQYDEKIKELNQDLFNMETKCDELEKEYLAKTLKLLYMVQTHCQIKGDNEKLLERYGIKEGNKKPDLSNFGGSNINPGISINELQPSNISNKNINPLNPA